MQTNFGSGHLVVKPLVDAAGNAISNPTPVRLGILQNFSSDASFDSKELYGSRQFPVDIGRGKGKWTGKSQFAQILAAAWNSTFFGQGVTTGSTAAYIDQTGSVIPSTPYLITPTVPGSGTYAGDLGVMDSNGLPLTRVAASPTTGQYSVNVGTGAYTFAAADTGKTVYISYTYTLTTGSTITVNNLDMGEMPTFEAHMFLKRKGKTTYILLPNACSSKFSLGTKQDDFVIPEMDFMAQADAAGRVAILSTSE